MKIKTFKELQKIEKHFIKENKKMKEKTQGYYCCKYMKELDEKEIIDYCPPNLTTLDIKKYAYPIYFCPFCGKEIEGSKKFVWRLKKQVIKLKRNSEVN